MRTHAVRSRLAFALLAGLICVGGSLGQSKVGDAKPQSGLKYWAQWRGPTWNGVAPQADPPVTWSATENLRWKTPLEGKGFATPIVWGDRIFLVAALALDKLTFCIVLPSSTRQWVQQATLIGTRAVWAEGSDALKRAAATMTAVRPS